MFRTKKVSKSAIGNGRTNIATRAMMPKGSKEFIKFGATDLSEKDWACCINFILSCQIFEP